MDTPDFSGASAPFERLAQYVAGELTPHEADAVVAWAALSTVNAELLESATIAWRATKREASANEAIEARVSDVLRQIGERQTVARVGTRVSSGRAPRSRTSTSVGIGLAIAFGVLLVIGMWPKTFDSLRSPSRGVSTQRYATRIGQRATVTLGDGSRVQLGPATTLIVTAQGVGEHVDAQVVGQAFFTVMHRQSAPFRVQVGRAVVQVLGTKFMTRQYATDSVARVIVTEGRVALSGRRKALPRHLDQGLSQVLMASMMGTVDDSGQVHVTPHIAVDEYTSWTTGQLVFRNAPLRSAVLEIGRAYGVEIRVTDSALAAQTLNATIPLEKQPLTTVLESLADVLNAHSVRIGQIITLVPGRSATARPLDVSPLHLLEHQYGR